MAIGMCRGPDIDIDLLISIFLKKLLLFGRHVTHSHCLSISFNQESRIASRNMDEIEVKVDIHSANASAGELKPAKRQGFEGAKSPEDQALITTALSPLKRPKVASSSSSSSSPRAQPPACQVEKCEADLADAKDYYRRHRVCEQHSKARIVLVVGHQQRFCQQCSRFHVLEEFDEAKRSCRRRLAGHNERRRKTPSDSSVDRLESNNHVNDNWLRHMKESDKMTMVLERNTTAKVCKEIKNH